MTFRAGSTIRNVKTGKPYLVIQAFKAAVLVVDLEAPEPLVTPQVILNRNFDEWDEDYNFDQKTERNHVEIVHYPLAQI